MTKWTESKQEWSKWNGREVEPMVGDFVMPDGWQTRHSSQEGSWLVADSLEWDRCDFRLPAGGPMNFELAVNVKVTGRKVHVETLGENWVSAKVRVEVEFVRDGEESTFSGGWMVLLDSGNRESQLRRLGKDAFGFDVAVRV